MNSALLAPTGHHFASYPQRHEHSTAWLDAWRALRSRVARAGTATLPAALEQAMQAAARALRGADETVLAQATQQARVQLSRAPHSARAQGEALALAAQVMARTLGKTPYDTQLCAAALMLQGQLVEMATGEGKTLAAGLTAAVAALGGVPVHVLTSNDYLVQRDRAALAPFYAALGLSSACVTAVLTGEQRAHAWRHDIVYTTASALVFDYLRDHLALGGERDAGVRRARALAAADAHQAAAIEPALPGLCFCLIDEADNILLDEAVMPLILSAPGPELDAAAYARALEIAGTLQRQRDYQLLPAQREVHLTDGGRARVAQAVQGAGGVLSPPRRAYELVQAALAAKHRYRRDRDYAVLGDTLYLIDELTGRIALGRQWQGPLHAMAEIKEGLPPSAPGRTLAQITYQRFFPRYLRLCGMSGTLREARHELRVSYAAPVARVALAKPAKRRWLGESVACDAASKWQRVVQAVAQHHHAGRPVLVGTDSVAASAQLSQGLTAAGIAHQVLNAVQDQDEAERIERAGWAGMVTVATNIAGRGTDIRPNAAALASGGLHVIATMRNRARRIDRQLLGRAARHGDPGSAQSILALDDALLTRCWPRAVLRSVARFANAEGRVPAWLARPLFNVAQSLSEWRERDQRRALRRADKHAGELYAFAGGTE